MGKRTGGGAAKKPKIGPAANDDPAAILGELFRPLPPNKRHDLNKIVEKLLHLTSNFSSEPTTPKQLFDEHMQIRAMLDQVIQLEKCNLNRKIIGPRRSYVMAFSEWLEKNGAVVDGVEITEVNESSGELGLRATKELKVGDVTLTIPRKLMMSLDTAKNSEIGRLIEKDLMLQKMNNVALSLHLLLEKTSPASFWEPYINVLPQSYNTVLYFSPDDFQELKGSPAYEDALKQYKYVARQYAYFSTKFQNTMIKDYFTFEEYRWAVSTVMTRQNSVPSETGEITESGDEVHVNTLIPFWDMANNSVDVPEISTDFDKDTQAVSCMANKEFGSAEDFTIFYGKRSNLDLLVHNGFVLENNPFDTLVIKLGISKNDQLARSKYDLLAKLVVSPHGHFALSPKPVDVSSLDPNLFAFLRVMNMSTEEQIGHWSERAKDLLVANCEDVELDQKSLNYLLTRCMLLLKSYPTSLEGDAGILSGEIDITDARKMSARRRMCVVLRKSEKEILNDTIKMCKDRLAMM